MSFDYFSSKNGRLAARLDKAWDCYKNSKLDDKNRKKALDFMIYVFDIRAVSKEPDALNKQLDMLMQKRQDKKATNPDYIPIEYSGGYDFEHTARILLATDQSLQSFDASIQRRFNAGTLLDVNDKDKQRDAWGMGVTYLDGEERAQFRLEIHNGLLCKNGKPFDSSKKIAHGKKGYVAFTLNSNGELSAFKHLGGVRDKKDRLLVHSSMNEGAPVLAAGEMEIKKGKLVNINTFSGHYQPSLYSLSHFLNYLTARTVDLSKTNVLLKAKPDRQSGLTFEEKQVSGDTVPWFKVPATQIMSAVDRVLSSNIGSINRYLDSNVTKVYQAVGLTTTQGKVELATKFKHELESIVTDINRPSASLSGKDALEKIEKLIDIYQEKNLSITASGRLADKFSQMKGSIQALKQETSRQSDDEVIQPKNNFKSMF